MTLELLEPGCSRGGRPPQPLGLKDRILTRVRKIPALGIWCSVISNTFFALNIVLTKAIVNERNVLPVGTIQCLVKLTLLIPVIIRRRLPLLGAREERKYLFCFAFSTAMFQILRTYAYAFITAGDASAIIMSYPVVVTLIAPFLLNETFRKIFVFNAILSVCGIFLVVRPSFIFHDNPGDVVSQENHTIGVLLSVASIFVMTSYCIFIRKLRHTSSVTSCAFSSWISVLCFGLPCLVTGTFQLPTCGWNSVFLVISAALHVADMLMYYIAYKFEEAGPLSVVGTIEIPLILALEMAVLGTVPSWSTCLGACLVLFGVILTALRKWEKARRKADHILNTIKEKCCAGFKA